MKTIQYSKDQLHEVYTALKEGKVIAFPTDTVYGLGVCYDDEDALIRLKKAKGRPDSKPIPMMVANVNQIKEVAYVSEKAERLIDAFMPGAFTVILKKKEHIPAYVNNGLDTLAIRMSDDHFILQLMNQLNKALLVSSANLSDQHSCRKGEEVLEQLNGRIDGIVMGESGSNIASTIVDLSGDEMKIVREGMITKAMIDKVMEETK